MMKQTLAAIVTEVEQNVKERKQDDGLRFHYAGASYDLADRTERMSAIQRVTDDYASAREERPVPELLERLTDAILDEELKDPNPHKVSHEEYPFMSEWQLDLRRDRETGLKAAEETGADGRNHRKPTRRRRTNYENWRVDRDAKGRNRARQEQYKRDTTAGPVVREATESFVSARGQAARWRDTLSLVQ